MKFCIKDFFSKCDQIRSSCAVIMIKKLCILDVYAGPSYPSSGATNYSYNSLLIWNTEGKKRKETFCILTGLV